METGELSKTAKIPLAIDNKILLNLYNGILKKRRVWFEMLISENSAFLFNLYQKCPKKAEIYISSTGFSFNFYDDLGLEIIGSIIILNKNVFYTYYDETGTFRDSAYTKTLREACLWLLEEMK